jgi:uracil-DNA glycosylase family 4
MFTGDRSGDWLFGALHRVGRAALPASPHVGGGQRLEHVRITAAVHCAPPDNKPTTAERHECASWLDLEVGLVEPTVRCMLALGVIAWTALLVAVRQAGWTVERVPFRHGASTQASSPSGRPVTLLASYHPSQQNTFTGRLTEPMLDDVLVRARTAAGL